MLDDLDTDATLVRKPSQMERESGKRGNGKVMVFIGLYLCQEHLYRQ
jgi:hypothetical protein